MTIYHRPRPVASLLITGGGGSFSQILDLFLGLEFTVASLGETSIFKIMTTDDVTSWSKLDFFLKSGFGI